MSLLFWLPWASYQIRQIAGCTCAWNVGNVFPATDLKGNWKPLVIDPGIHQGAYVTHVPCCLSGSITRGGGKNVPRHSRRMRYPQFNVSVKRPMISSRLVWHACCTYSGFTYCTVLLIAFVSRAQFGYTLIITVAVFPNGFDSDVNIK